MSDGNELAELLWENGQAVVHGLRDPPQPAFRSFGTGSSGVQENHPGGGGDNNNMMAFTKAGSVYGGMGRTPSLHDLDSGLHASHENGDDDTVPWIHYPIIEDDDNTDPADYWSDFFSEAAAAAATANLGSLPPSPNHNATNSRGTPVASSSSRAPSKEIHGLQAEFAAAKQPQPSGSGEGVMNFSLFSRPAALARATLQSAQSGHVFANQRAVWPQPKEVRFASAAAPAPAVSVGNLQQEMAREKAIVATSSVCSCNDESWHQHRSECSASQDEDLDDESGTLLRSASRSMKRSRTAEAHNLSERRRRGRINEKLRALQELIPNCNKIDKASMLDEAIEYLKTLQLQVQMMSMGIGLCIPPVLLPPAIQHLQKNSMAHFPHLGMGLGYGMGVFGMNITGSIPISPLPGAHFPCQMIPGASPQGIGIPGVNATPMFGVPGQANSSPRSSVPPFTSLAGLPGRQNPAPQVSGATARNSESTTTKFEQGTRARTPSSSPPSSHP